MLDFTAFNKREQTINDVAEGLTVRDLHLLTDEMIDTIAAIIADAQDADVTFVPSDPQAKDTFGKAEDADLAWTLGHVIVHGTASSEESAAISANLARGLVIEGRSRYETDWQSVHTVAELQQRLDESRRMRHSFLNAWPDAPHLDVTYVPFPGYVAINAVSRFIFGLAHDDSHLEQLREIMRQTRNARA